MWFRFPPAPINAMREKSIQEIAIMRGIDAWDTFFDLVQLNGVDVDPKSMDENSEAAGAASSVCQHRFGRGTHESSNRDFTHIPRTFGTFPRVLAKYVREEKVITLENAIREMTSPASQSIEALESRSNQSRHGRRPGSFDPAKITDTATFAKPLSCAVGVDFSYLVRRATSHRYGEAHRHPRREYTSASPTASLVSCRVPGDSSPY